MRTQGGAIWRKRFALTRACRRRYAARCRSKQGFASPVVIAGG